MPPKRARQIHAYCLTSTRFHLGSFSEPPSHITYTKQHLIAALLDIFDIMYKDMDLEEYKLMLDQLNATELRNELPVEDNEMDEFMEPYLTQDLIKK